ncbi:MAG: pyruvate dehydrogenase (acetyl-transferring) E1 component subunit alpha [Acidobacteriota bacterium]
MVLSMPKKKISLGYEIDYLSILDEKGKVDQKLEPKIPKEDLLKLYRTMLLSREFDERMLRMQRQGRLRTIVPSRGQEAASLGSCYALRKADWIVPYFREVAALLWRGWSMEQFLLCYAGYEEGMLIPEGINDLPLCVPVATQNLHAVGLAWAAKLKGDDSVTLCYFGDGATSEGDFHEALNFASVYQVPAIFLCQNNQYAISTPVSKQSHSKTLAQKALAYDMAGIQVDGNDFLAVYAATREAVERAKKGEGPTLIEAVTYRLSYHTTADDPTRYRSQQEVEVWEKKDPLLRFYKYLEKKDLMDEERRDKWLKEIGDEVRAAVKRAEARMNGNPLDMFDYTFADLPAALRTQRKELAEFLKAEQLIATS